MNSSDNNKFNLFKTDPIKFLAGIYIYLIVVIIIIGLIYVYSLNEITTQTVPPRLNSEITEVDLTLQNAKVIPAIDLFSLVDPSQEFIAKGQKLFEQTCSSCHGNAGKGDGTAGAALNPKPRDFTDSTGWVNGTKLDDIYKTLEEGIPGSGMASYSYLLPEEKLAMSSYIRSAFAKNAPSVTGDDLMNLDANYNLSQGVSQPPQIPVKKATEFIIKENVPVVEKIKAILSSINNIKVSSGKDIFEKVTSDQFTALTTLNADLSWKKDQKLFISIIVNDALNNGFKGQIFQLSSNEWSALYNFLNRQIK